MPDADHFAAITRGITKPYRGFDGSHAARKLGESFVSCVPYIPENLKYDVAAYFRGAYAPNETMDEINTVASKLLDVVFLFEREYERAEATFSESDWAYIRDIVSEFAIELDQEVLTYVMQQVVSRGLIGE